MVVVKIMRRGEEVVDYEEQGVKVEDQIVKRMCSLRSVRGDGRAISNETGEVTVMLVVKELQGSWSTAMAC